MEFKGTKGSWCSYTAVVPSIKEPTKHSVYSGTKRIALCYDFFESDKSKNVYQKEAESNAKLIAAAPDLLEASRGLVDYLLSDQCYSSKNPNIEPLIKAINKALK